MPLFTAQSMIQSKNQNYGAPKPKIDANITSQNM